MFFKKLYLPVQLFFILIGLFVIFGKNWLLQWRIDYKVLTLGNLVLFLVTLYSLYFYQRALKHPSTAGFLRNTYGGLMIKLFVCAFSVLIYMVTTRGHINKPALFTCIFLYFLYTILEMVSLMRWNKASKNA